MHSTVRILISFLLALLATHAWAEKNEPQFRKAVNCAVLPDGNYVWGCSRFYSICTNGREYAMECYAGLKLNPDNNQCESMAVISACQNGKSSTLYRSKDPFVCVQDGFFEAAACSAAYIQCSQGRRFDLTCPVGLVFNAVKGVCDYSSNCKKKSSNNGKNSKRRIARISYMAQQQPVLADSFNDPVAPQAPLNQYHSQQYQYQPLQRQQQPTTTVLPIVQQADPSQTTFFDCTGKTDGIYLEQETACTSTFWKCANNQAFSYNCTTGLFYNVQNNQCDYQFNVVACGGTTPDSSITTTTQVPPPTINAPFFDCTGKTDGLYTAQSCVSSFFYSCVGGTSTAMKCSPGLVFDALSNACEYTNTCGIPKTTVSPQQQDPVRPNLEHGTSGYYFGNISSDMPPYTQQNQLIQNGNNSNAAQAAVGVEVGPSEVFEQQHQQQQSSSFSFNCTGKSNGYYVKQSCAREFFTCSNGVTNKVSCPDNLVFNVQKAACDFPDTCQLLMISSNTNLLQTEQQVQQQVQSSSQPLSVLTGFGSQQQQQQMQSLSSINCVGRPDGYYYKQACQNTFFICAAGISASMLCPDGTVFQPSITQCQFPSQCAEQQQQAPTGGGGQANNVPGLQSALQQQQIQSSSAQKTSLQSQQQSRFNCAENPCQSGFMNTNCSGGQACLNELNGLSDHTSETNTIILPINNNTTQQIEQPSVQQQQNGASQTSLSISPLFNCLGKQDGNYLRRQCQSTYIVCSGGVAVELSCPSGLMFDANTAQCEFPSDCGQANQQHSNNVLPQQLTPQSQPQQQQNQFQIPAARQTHSAYAATVTAPNRLAFLPPSASGFTCTGRIDGYYYKIACEPHFFTCVGGHATQLTCPGDLVFDPTQALCQYRNVCGQQSSSNNTTVPMPQPPAPQIDFNCAGKRNGYYVRKPCSPEFYTCLGGLVTKLTCPANLVFDTQSVSCQYPDICAGGQTNTDIQQQ